MMIKVVDDKPELVIELRKRIQAYKRMHPNLTSQQIAKRFGVSNATFNRLENLNLKKPSLDQVIKILRGLGNNEDLIDFLRLNYPDIVDTIERHVDEKRRDEEENSVDMLKMMIDAEDGRILRYVKAKEGQLKRQEIEFNFGQRGLQSLDRLESKGYVFIRDGYYWGKEGYRFTEPEAIKKLAVEEIKDSFDSRGKREGRTLNFMTYQTISLNVSKALPLIISEYKTFLQKFDEIISDEENLGDTPIWLVGAVDTMLNNNLRELMDQEEKK